MRDGVVNVAQSLEGNPFIIRFKTQLSHHL